MPPYSTDVTSSSDDEDAPEALSLIQSKRNAETHDDALNKFKAAEKAKRKERNRARDRKLKERAEKTRNTKTSATEREDAHGRMERAMRNAEEEMNEDGSESENDYEGSAKETGGGDEVMEMVEDKNDGVMESDDDGSQDETSESPSEQSQAKPKRNSQHLPDHIFTSAFTPRTQLSSSKRQLLASVSRKSDTVKRRKHRARAKDLTAGYVSTSCDSLIISSNPFACSSRAIRVLSNASRSGSGSAMTLPPLKIKKFVNRSLNLKGNPSKTKAWERRPGTLICLVERHHDPHSSSFS